MDDFPDTERPKRPILLAADRDTGGLWRMTVELLRVGYVANACKGYTRPLREGEEYYNSGLLLCVGLKESSGSERVCQALAAQTSAVMDKPYQIEVKLDVSKPDGEKVLNLKCSCTAGESEKCKHVVSALIYLNRTKEDDLDDISCTDLEQQWGSLKKSHQKEYEAKCIMDSCHVDPQHNVFAGQIPDVAEEMKLKWKNKLMNCKFNV